MWDRITFKATGKANFKANYWPFVAVSVLYALLFGNLLTLNFNNSSRELSDLISLLAPFAITGFALKLALPVALNVIRSHIELPPLVGGSCVYHYFSVFSGKGQRLACLCEFV